MEEWLEQTKEWQANGEQVALATVVRVSGSTPRHVGARMLISSEERIAGSVSGGCVETEVAQEALDSLEIGDSRLLHFGITKEMGWEVGLACGGEIDVLVEPSDPDMNSVIQGHIDKNQLFAMVTIIHPNDSLGQKAIITADGEVSYSTMSIDPAIFLDAVKPRFEEARGETVSLPDHDVEVFIEPYLPQPLLIVIGGAHIAISLVKYAKELGFRVIVADPRVNFANMERFPDVDEILIEWPDEALSHLTINQVTYIVILTHDPKIDEPALTSLLGLSDDGAPLREPRYIGAIGSRKTHADRFGRMAKLGVTAEQLKRVYAPIGLDLGGMTPPEIALSIMAEIISVKNGRSGGFLREGSSPIGL